MGLFTKHEKYNPESGKFEAVENGAIIRLREYGYEDTPSGRRGILECAAGWGEALTLLKFYVEHGITY